MSHFSGVFTLANQIQWRGERMVGENNLLKNGHVSRLSFSFYSVIMLLFTDSFIRLYTMFSSFVCFVIHLSVHLF